MRQYFILISAIQCITALNTLLGQTTYWVSNDPSYLDIVDFNNLQTAINTASIGDTIMIYPSGIPYGAILLDKSLHLKGIGYDYTELLQPSLEIETFGMNAISQNFQIINASDATISGLKLNILTIQNSNAIQINKNSIGALHLVNSTFVSVASCYIGGAFINNCNLHIENSTNNLVANNLFWQYTTLNNLNIELNCGNNVLLNNIFNAQVYVRNGEAHNNIFVQGDAFFTNTLVENNLFNGSIAGSPPGNLYNVDMSTVFVGYPIQGAYSFDSRYQLLPNSPARDYGVNGVDCGVFDGDFPYRLSGITNMPIVSELVVPTSTYNDQMEITIRVKIID